MNLHKSQGFSLLELLCAMSIGLIIILLLGEIFVNFKKTYAIESALSSMQENARFAAYIMRYAIEQAGFIGSAKITNKFPIIDYGVRTINQITNKNYFMLTVPKVFNINPKNGADVVVAKSMAAITANLTQDLNNSNKIYVTLNPKFNSNDDIIIADCSHAVLVHLRSAYSYPNKNQQILTATRIINDKFNQNAEVGKIQTNAFYIPKNKDALYIIDANGKRSELIPNIIGLKITSYPTKILDWSKIKVLKIKLLLVSQDNVLPKAKEYQFDQHKFYPKDRRLYKEFQFVIKRSVFNHE